MLTANILFCTLAENLKRKLDGSKYSHTPDKLFCTPSVRSQPPAWIHIFLKILYHVITGEKSKGLLFPAYWVNFHLLSHKQASKSIYRFLSCSQGVNKFSRTHAPLAPASASDHPPCSAMDSAPVSLSSSWNNTSYILSAQALGLEQRHMHFEELNN